MNVIQTGRRVRVYLAILHHPDHTARELARLAHTRKTRHIIAELLDAGLIATRTRNPPTGRPTITYHATNTSPRGAPTPARFHGIREATA